MFEPEVLLLDELLSNLDGKMRLQTRGEFRALQHTRNHNPLPLAARKGRRVDDHAVGDADARKRRCPL